MNRSQGTATILRFMTSLSQILPSTRRGWVVAVVIFCAFFASFQISRFFYIAPAVLSPSAGVGFAALLLAGIHLWPALYLAALASQILNGASIISIIFFPIAHALQAIIGTFFLKRLGFDSLIGRRRDMFAFIPVALFVSMIVPTLGFAIRAVDTWLLDASPLAVSWGSWWAGTLMSILILTPFLVRWVGKPRMNPRTPVQITESFIAFALLAAIIIPLSWFQVTQLGGISLVYFMLFPLFWIALRLGPRFTTLALLFTTLNLLGGLLAGVTPIPPEQLSIRIFNLEIFVNVIALMFLILVGIEEERKTVNHSLRLHVSRLEEALAQLRAQSEAKSEFLAVLAHELRNPLAPLLSTVELLKLRRGSGEDNPEELKMLQAAEERVRTMAHLLDDLLDVSRISQATFELHKEDIELRPAVTRAIEIAAPLMDLREHTVELDLPKGQVWLRVDPVRFEQMLGNLLTNAAKYTEHGGRIQVHAKIVNDGITLSVSDNGVGIPHEMLDKVFEPFRQIPTKRSSGLGIGLSVVKKLAEMHGGSITASSEGVGKGSEFTLVLPRTLQQTPVHAREKESDAPQSTSALKVLVVDDNEEAAHSLGKLLTLRGHNVTLAHGGADAITSARRDTPNVILLDIGLPDMDGYEVARNLREDETPSTLIALTGYGQEEDKQRAKNAGFDFHLTKPVGLAEIEGLFAQIIAKTT